jgi:hypothetical protein
MTEAQPTSRQWFIDLAAGEARLRCAFQRRGKTIEQFTVQLEISLSGTWQAVARYDNAHGFCHRDTLHPDGTQEKTAVYVGDLNATFTYAIADLRNTWATHRERFLREMKS